MHDVVTGLWPRRRAASPWETASVLDIGSARSLSLVGADLSRLYW